MPDRVFAQFLIPPSLVLFGVLIVVEGVCDLPVYKPPGHIEVVIMFASFVRHCNFKLRLACSDSNC